VFYPRLDNAGDLNVSMVHNVTQNVYLRTARAIAMTVRQAWRSRKAALNILLGAVPLALAVVVGCSSRTLNSPPEQLIDKPWLNAGEVAPGRDGDVDTVTGLSELLAGKPPTVAAPGRPLNVLVMSGGGKYGAFTAGALVGWSQTGTRPQFDIATGISSGATIAALAFLGPKYDHKLETNYTNLVRSDLFTWRPVRGLVTGTGLMSSEPLEKILEREVDCEFMKDLCAAHGEGRRLYVGTGNILTNRFAVWDLGAIACSGRPDAMLMVRKILLASCSVPGVVKPVEFKVEVNGTCYTEWHGDAGNFSQAFVRSPAGITANSNVWVLSAGKVYRDPVQKKPTVFSQIGAAVSNSLYSLFRADLIKLYALCTVTHSNFKLLAMPQDFHAETSSAAFDPQELKQLYKLGLDMGSHGPEVWRTTPPDTMPHEATPPRTGLQFVTP
jgi:hypothetical protein